MGADKLLYCSLGQESNDLVVIDRNTMNSMIVTCKGRPFWVFNDYLMVSKVGSVRHNSKFCTMDVQGFISETSVAEMIYACVDMDDGNYPNFPWSLCLEIALCVGS